MIAEPLIQIERQIREHFSSLGNIFKARVDSDGEVALNANWGIIPLVAGLVGQGCEVTSRNRGPDVRVAPIVRLDSGLWAWAGYREEWDAEAPAGRVRRYSFRSAGLTVHFGYRNLKHKPQMFRAEWAGVARWNGTDYCLQAGDAAHPHWQFDALESLSREHAEAQAETYLAVLKQEEEEIGPRDFSPHGISANEVGELILVQELSRLHFASAAAWWKAAPNGGHAHIPGSVRDIQTWVRETLSYVVSELARLQRV